MRLLGGDDFVCVLYRMKVLAVNVIFEVLTVVKMSVSSGP